MSASNWFIGVGMLAVAAAGGALAYRMHNAPAAPVNLTCAAPPAPVINIPAPVVNVAAPASREVDTTAGVVKPLEIAHAAPRKKKKAKRSAVSKLKSKWGLQ